jgi:hypothetical protein
VRVRFQSPAPRENAVQRLGQLCGSCSGEEFLHCVKAASFAGGSAAFERACCLRPVPPSATRAHPRSLDGPSCWAWAARCGSHGHFASSTPRRSKTPIAADEGVRLSSQFLTQTSRPPVEQLIGFTWKRAEVLDEGDADGVDDVLVTLTKTSIYEGKQTVGNAKLAAVEIAHSQPQEVAEEQVHERLSVVVSQVLGYDACGFWHLGFEPVNERAPSDHAASMPRLPPGRTDIGTIGSRQERAQRGKVGRCRSIVCEYHLSINWSLDCGQYVRAVEGECHGDGC